MKRARRGFTLIEVLAAFAIALLILAPVGMIIAGVSGSMGALDRSAERREMLQRAAYAAASLAPVREGSYTVDDFLIRVEARDTGRDRDLEDAGWRLYALVVSHRGAADGDLVLETLRLERP